MSGMDIQYIRLQSGEQLPSMEGFSPFKAIVVVDGPVERDWQRAASEWLAKSGCLYMLAHGRDCSSWDDSVDWANIEQFGFGEIPDDNFIVTTWHENESLPDVVEFAEVAAFHPTVEIEKLLFFHIGNVDREDEIRKLFDKV
ncbi:MAG: hypothetical protein ABJM26_18970 [Anderseniella sp.]